jgi:hypothetical protein
MAIDYESLARRLEGTPPATFQPPKTGPTALESLERAAQTVRQNLAQKKAEEMKQKQLESDIQYQRAKGTAEVIGQILHLGGNSARLAYQQALGEPAPEGMTFPEVESKPTVHNYHHTYETGNTGVVTMILDSQGKPVEPPVEVYTKTPVDSNGQPLKNSKGEVLKAGDAVMSWERVAPYGATATKTQDQLEKDRKDYEDRVKRITTAKKAFTTFVNRNSGIWKGKAGMAGILIKDKAAALEAFTKSNPLGKVLSKDMIDDTVEEQD